MSDKPRTVEEIEAEIQRTRLAMQSTVDELTGRLDPRAQAKSLADKAKVTARDLSRKAQTTVEEAKAGDPNALAKLASVATGVAVLGGLLVWRSRR